MLHDDDLPRPTPQLVPHPPLDRLGVDELHAYIAGLEGEIARARAEVVRKEALRDAAASMFRTAG